MENNDTWRSRWIQSNDNVLTMHNNNLAAAVLHLFIGAISIHGLASRVRADFGVKNVDVARFMLDCPECGNNKGGFIAGTSVHSQCSYKVCSKAFP